MLRTDWTSGGNPHWVETARWGGESQADWEARHAAAVAFWQMEYPPD